MNLPLKTSPFPETNYTIFHSLAKKLEDITQSDCTVNDTKDVFLFHPDSIRIITEEVGRLGFKRVSDDVRRGSSALVFEANDHQVLRVVAVKVGEQPRSGDWDVLQPLISRKCGSGDNEFVIELLPKVHTLYEITHDTKLSAEYRLTKNDVSGIVRQLLINNLQKKYSQVFYDPCPRNIGIIRDKKGNNVPVVIDPGAIVDRDRLDDNLWHNERFRDVFIRRCGKENTLPEFIDRKPERESYERFIYSYLRFLSEQSPPPYNFEEAQMAHMERLGLEYGKAKGAISNDVMARFRARQKKDGVYSNASVACMDMSENDGFYDKEIGDIVARANTGYPKDSFCQGIAEERKKYLRTLW